MAQALKEIEEEGTGSNGQHYYSIILRPKIDRPNHTILGRLWGNLHLFTNDAPNDHFPETKSYLLLLKSPPLK